MSHRINVLIVGASGMLGHTLFGRLFENDKLDTHATVRSVSELSRWFTDDHLLKIHGGIDADNFDSVLAVLAQIKPDVVINCVGVIKQLPAAEDPVVCIATNALFPHRLAAACKAAGARLVHISTDCVFSGEKGDYRETDRSDATDLYGRSKFLGEVTSDHCVTLRTSIIGHELKGGYGLVEWFLSRKGPVRGFTNAIYTGFPTIEITRIIEKYIICDMNLKGLYQVASEPISKYELLELIAAQYGKKIEIIPFGDFHCYRSLNSDKFRNATGYSAPAWPELIAEMHNDYVTSPWYRHKLREGSHQDVQE